MLDADIKQILRKNDLLFEENLQTVLRESMAEEMPVELTVDNRPKVMMAQFLPPSPATNPDPNQTSSVFFLPLQEELSNELLQQSHKIKIHFVMDVYSLECSVHFKGVGVAAGEQTVEFSYPRVIQVTSRRKMLRHPLNEETATSVQIKRKDKRVITLSVRDVHMEGLCIFDEEGVLKLKKDDRFYVNLNSRKLGVFDVSLYGRLCYSHGLSFATLHGVEFVGIEDYLSLKNFMIKVKSVKPPEPEIDIDQLVEDVFGKDF